MNRCENCGASITDGMRCTDCGAAWFQSIIERVTYEPWSVVMRRDDGRCYLQVRDDHGRCNATGEAKPWGGRKWMLSSHMTETEVVKTALKAVLSAVEHETLENFKYDGVTVFDPHLRVEDLLRVRQSCPLDGRV